MATRSNSLTKIDDILTVADHSLMIIIMYMNKFNTHVDKIFRTINIHNYILTCQTSSISLSLFYN